MADQRKGGIAWTEHTWGPIRGCSRVNASCINCYAEAVAVRFSGDGLPYEGLVRISKKDGTRLGWNGVVRRVDKHMLDPVRWQRGRHIFVNSMSDMFHENLPFNDIAAIFGIMAAAPQHTFQVLTKRPQRALDFFAWAAEQDAGLAGVPGRLHCLMAALDWEREYDPKGDGGILHCKHGADPDGPWPLPNVHLGVSVGDQKEADEFVPLAIQYPASVVWISQEPQHGAIEYRSEWLAKIGWIVIGGESGPNARPFNIAWAENTIAQCRENHVPVFVKQMGSFPMIEVRDPFDETTYTWKNASKLVPLRLKDGHGGDPAEWPECLRVREWPVGYLPTP